jgi:hypothetical protein
MDRSDDFDRAGNLGRVTALIAEKRRTRVQLVLGNIDPQTAETRLRSADAELARQWDHLRGSRARPTWGRPPAA